MKKEQRQYDGEKLFFSTNGTKKMDMLKINTDTDVTPLTKVSSKWIIELNVKCKAIELLEDNSGESLNDLGLSDDSLDWTPKT